MLFVQTALKRRTSITKSSCLRPIWSTTAMIPIARSTSTRFSSKRAETSNVTRNWPSTIIAKAFKSTKPLMILYQHLGANSWLCMASHWMPISYQILYEMSSRWTSRKFGRISARFRFIRLQRSSNAISIAPHVFQVHIGLWSLEATPWKDLKSGFKISPQQMEIVMTILNTITQDGSSKLPERNVILARCPKRHERYIQNSIV